MSLQEASNAMPYISLSIVHGKHDVSECQLKLNHPELCQMAGRVAVLSPTHQIMLAVPKLSKKTCRYCTASRQRLPSKALQTVCCLTIYSLSIVS